MTAYKSYEMGRHPEILEVTKLSAGERLYIMEGISSCLQELIRKM